MRVESRAIGIDTSERLRMVGRTGFGISLGMACALTMATGLGVATGAFGLWLVVYASGVTSLGALAAAGSRRRPRESPGAVEIRDGALFLEPARGRAAFARQSFPLETIVQGWEEPYEVRFAARNGRTVTVRTQGAVEGDRLLQAAGVSTSLRALRIPLASAAARAPGGAGVAGLLLGFAALVVFLQIGKLAEHVGSVLRDEPIDGTWWRPALLLAVFAAATIAGSRAFRRREAVVGTDGILVRRSFGDRLVRYTDLERALPDTRGVILLRKDGARMLLPTLGAEESPLRPRLPGPGEPFTDAEARRSALLARIAQAMSAPVQGSAAWASLDQLDRKGRALGAWRADLGRVLARATDYRNVGLGPGDLAGVLEDASAPAERRIAAAVALSSAQPEEARKRARIAADACADEELRRALTRAAEGELDEELLEHEEKRATRTV